MRKEYAITAVAPNYSTLPVVTSKDYNVWKITKVDYMAMRRMTEGDLRTRSTSAASLFNWLTKGC